MKLGPVTKLDKRNKPTSKKVDVDVMSGSCDVIVIFRTQSAKVIFLVIVTFCLTKTESSTKKSLMQLSHYIALSKGTFLDKKR